MSQDNAPNKPVHLIYLCGGVLLFFLLQWSIDWIWGYFARVPGEMTVSLASFLGAVIISIALYRNDRAFGLINEISTELKKVTWPTAKEVRTATIVVIVMSLISAVILFMFDFVWSKLTDLVYG